MSSADAVAAVLWVGATMYAVFGGADFGAGFWSLVAGGGERGRRARELIDWAIGPVWEANHVWLIFVLVVLWTGFSSAFAAIFSTLFIPLSLAALGHRAARLGVRVPQDGAAHAGPRPRRAPVRPLVAAHAVLHGHRRWRDRVGARAARQRRRRSRHELAQPGLARDRRAVRGHVARTSRPCSSSATRGAPRVPDLVHYFTVRALGAALVAGAFAIAGIVVLHADAPHLYDRLTSEALPLVIVSGLCGLAVLVLLRRGAARGAAPPGGRRASSP